MDAFLVALRNLSNLLMPSLGAICLICLIIIFIKLIKVLNSINSTLLKTHGTIDLVDKSIEKVQSPLDTVVKVSETVDKAHEVTLSAARNAKDYVVSNTDEIKSKIRTFVNKEEKINELKEPSPEDIIGG